MTSVLVVLSIWFFGYWIAVACLELARATALAKAARLEADQRRSQLLLDAMREIVRARHKDGREISRETEDHFMGIADRELRKKIARTNKIASIRARYATEF